ncbi:hypothetical protein R1sor_000034 [Riccia sorocarpa]|uniref:Uncharacterized protein n=1 Tax=Riccia sorocarpa TaxID=122646 RepID=A0ABD3GV18_9MARC
MTQGSGDTDSLSTTPRSRRARPALSEEEVVTVSNVNRAVTNADVYSIFPKVVVVEFSLTFVKLLYATVILGREVDFRRLSGSSQTPRKRGRDDGSASSSPNSALAIVPTGEGSSRQLFQTFDEVFAEAESSLALEEATPVEVLSWISTSRWALVEKVHFLHSRARVAALEAVGRRIGQELLEEQAERRKETEAAAKCKADLTRRLADEKSMTSGLDQALQELRLEHGNCAEVFLDEAAISASLREELQAARSETEVLMQEIDDMKNELQTLSEFADSVDGVDREILLRAELGGVRVQLDEALLQTQRLSRECLEKEAELHIAMSETDRLEREVYKMREDALTLSRLGLVGHVPVPGSLQPAPEAPGRLEQLEKELKENVDAEIKEAAWIAQARVLKVEDKLRKTRELLQGRCVAEFDSTTEAARSPSGLRQKFHALKRVELQLQRERADLDAAAQRVSWKFRTKHHHLKNMQEPSATSARIFLDLRAATYLAHAPTRSTSPASCACSTNAQNAESVERIPSSSLVSVLIGRQIASGTALFGTAILQDDDRSDGYNLRDEAINLMCFYLCPKEARPYTVADTSMTSSVFLVLLGHPNAGTTGITGIG